jgi:hypothetical protein
VDVVAMIAPRAHRRRKDRPGPILRQVTGPRSGSRGAWDPAFDHGESLHATPPPARCKKEVQVAADPTTVTLFDAVSSYPRPNRILLFATCPPVDPTTWPLRPGSRSLGRGVILCAGDWGWHQAAWRVPPGAGLSDRSATVRR